jgi:hypothetical protein
MRVLAAGPGPPLDVLFGEVAGVGLATPLEPRIPPALTKPLGMLLAGTH